MAFAVLRLITNVDLASGFILLAGMIFKIYLERQGMSLSGVVPVWQAHCAGAAAGLIVSLTTSVPKFRIISGVTVGRTS
jgi:hypothetical protein